MHFNNGIPSLFPRKVLRGSRREFSKDISNKKSAVPGPKVENNNNIFQIDVQRNNLTCNIYVENIVT